MRTAIYARRSTVQQDQSVERQVRECKEYAARHDLTIVATYSDTASAWKPHTPRPEFDRMLQDASHGAFEALIVWETSRLSRQQGAKSALAKVWELDELSVQVHALDAPHTGMPIADDFQWLMKSHVADQESTVKSQRVRSGKRGGMLRGIYQGATAPFGYRFTQRRVESGRAVKFYEPDPEPARIVREIFTMYLDGSTPQQIANDLDSRGIAPPGDPTKPHRYKRRGEPVWHQSVVRDLLANPLLGGFMHYKGVRIKSCGCASLDEIAAAKGLTERRSVAARWAACEHEWVRAHNVAPALVDMEVWEQAHQALEVRARPGQGGRRSGGYAAENFLLAGLLWCGLCGERIGARHDHSGRSRKSVAIYLCRGRRLGSGCELPRLKADELDEAVRQSFLRGFVDVQETLKKGQEVMARRRNNESGLVHDELRVVETEWADAQRFLTKLDHDYEAGQIGAENYERLCVKARERLQTAEQARERLSSRLETLATEEGTSLDHLLDTANALSRIVEGGMEQGDKLRLHERLVTVIERYTVDLEGSRVVLTPSLREGILEGEDWVTLDFSEGENSGVEVVEYLDPPALKQVSLWGDELSGSW